jgi:putative ABC transport system permease protein
MRCVLRIMFSLSYMLAELRRRRGRTLLTALGLGTGVGLVVCVTALSTGLDRAQDEVLAPLTGVGTDLSVTRPIEVSGGPEELSDDERAQLQQENGVGRVGLQNLGEPGEKFSTARFMSTSQLSFPATEVEDVAALDGVTGASGSLTLSATVISGTVPEQSEAPGQGAPGGGAGGAPPGDGPRDVDIDATTVTGVDPASAELAPVAPGQITDGAYLSGSGEREAILNVAYANRKGKAVGDHVRLDGKRYTVVGLAASPLGGTASDLYIPLAQLQAMSDRKGRVNTISVRAASTDAVAGVERAIAAGFEGAAVTTSADLAERVSGSLVDAKNLSGKLGTALTVVGLAAAFLIAILLTLASVTKRTRELGTLKAIGWPGRSVVVQVTGESLLQGALGGVIGALLGIGGAALIGALGPELTATVAAAAEPASRGFGPPGMAGFGQGAITAGSTNVPLDAPVDLALIVLAISLALLGGLLAGSVGGLRASRLRPAVALRTLD